MALLCAEFGIPFNPLNSAAYIALYLRGLSGERQCVVVDAARMAGLACDFIIDADDDID